MVLKLPLALRRQNNLWNSVPTTLLQTIRIYSFKTRKSCTKVLYVDEQSFKLALSLGQDRHATPTPLFCPFGLRCCPYWIYCFCVARTPCALKWPPEGDMFSLIRSRLICVRAPSPPRSARPAARVANMTPRRIGESRFTRTALATAKR